MNGADQTLRLIGQGKDTNGNLFLISGKLSADKIVETVAVMAGSDWFNAAVELKAVEQVVFEAFVSSGHASKAEQPKFKPFSVVGTTY